MPNWAFVDYRMVGDEKSLEEIYRTMKELEGKTKPLVDNGFGKTWLGNIVATLGENLAEVECRGKWNYVVLDEDGVYISVEAAWREPKEFRLFLEKRFSGIKIFFQSIGDGFWQTNDAKGLYFPHYYLYTEEMGEDYYGSLEELITEVERITEETGLESLEECENTLLRYSEENGDCEVYVGEFDILV